MHKIRFGRSGAKTHSLTTFISLAILGFGLSTAVNGVQAQPAGVRSLVQPIAEAGAAWPTDGWVQFCAHQPAECAVDTSEPATIKLTRKNWQMIEQVNRRVNASIKPITDREHWGIEDRWDFAEDGYGDCEDIQLVKRRELARAGLPRRAMRMTVVIDEQGEGHAVMMIRTDRGDFILDNKRNAVLPWDETGYLYVKREGSSGAEWASLGGRGSASMTANR
ncbi:transglutaminase-like cysteine peptidase [Microvirga roseola]|uniref:transglutaminase-like cysteine peptidase n=1 Tax=Microvirga roseola TaxID=2883126 RepID=UPI0038996734